MPARLPTSPAATPDPGVVGKTARVADPHGDTPGGLVDHAGDADPAPTHQTDSPPTDPVIACLCARVGRGDQAAFADLYEAWFDRCHAMARSLTGRDESFCLDVVQETMLRVARRIPPMECERDLARWMVRAVHSSAIDLLRRESRAKRRESAAARQPVSPPAPALDAAEWLTAALRELDAQEHAMLTLRYGRGASLEVVGKAQGLSADAAHGRLRRLLGRLRSSMSA